MQKEDVASVQYPGLSIRDRYTEKEGTAMDSIRKIYYVTSESLKDGPHVRYWYKTRGIKC